MYRGDYHIYFTFGRQGLYGRYLFKDGLVFTNGQRIGHYHSSKEIGSFKGTLLTTGLGPYGIYL